MTVQIVEKNGRVSKIHNVQDIRSNIHVGKTLMVFYVYDIIRYAYNRKYFYLNDILSMVIKEDEDADSD